jgi:hypothetical protein
MCKGTRTRIRYTHIYHRRKKKRRRKRKITKRRARERVGLMMRGDPRRQRRARMVKERVRPFHSPNLHRQQQQQQQSRVIRRILLLLQVREVQCLNFMFRKETVAGRACEILLGRKGMCAYVCESVCVQCFLLVCVCVCPAHTSSIRNPLIVF